MKKILTIIITLMTSLTAMADAIGTWKLYPSYAQVQEVQASRDSADIYVLANGNLFSYHKKDNTLTEYVKEGSESAFGHSLDVLSTSNISHIAWVQSAKTLVIVYEDYMIDLLNSDNEVTSVVSLQNTIAFRDKTVDSIYVNGNYAFLRTSEHIVKVNVKEGYVEKTYKVGDEVAGMPELSVTPAANATPTYNYPIPNGPSTSYCWRLYKHDGKLFVTAGAYAYGFRSARQTYKGIVNYLEGDTWQELESPGKMTGYDYKAANCMTFDPRDKNHFWVGAATGLYEYRNYQPVAAYNSTNSELGALYNHTQEYSNITSLTYDATGNNLWMTTGWCDKFLAKLPTNGNITAYTFDGYTYGNYYSIDLQSLAFSTTNRYLWFANSCYSSNGSCSIVYYYDYASEVMQTFSSFVNQDGSTIAPNYIFNLKEDKEGNMWIASSSGPFYWAKADIAANNKVVTQYKINRDDGSGLADYLLNGVSTRCIDIDKAGRKWFGTSGSGLYLISEDNNTELQHFTMENSAILSDEVYDVMVDDETGVVWIATSNGLCSYQSDVTESYGTMNSDNVYAYPNPVAPEYTGMITIKGLTSNSQVTITTSSGYVVHKGVCSGASYQWDGCDGNGDRVASGVYMVLVSTETGEKGCVTKIAMVK